MGPGLSNKLSEPPFADLTDVTLADEDTNSTLIDNTNRAFRTDLKVSPGDQMQLMPSGS